MHSLPAPGDKDDMLVTTSEPRATGRLVPDLAPVVAWLEESAERLCVETVALESPATQVPGGTVVGAAAGGWSSVLPEGGRSQE